MSSPYLALHELPALWVLQEDLHQLTPTLGLHHLQQ